MPVLFLFKTIDYKKKTCSRFMEEHKTNTLEDEMYEYDEDGNIIWTWKKVIDPLQPIDHSAMDYAPFSKNFYQEHDQIK